MKKITLAKNTGFCFGVRRAIQLAKSTAKKYNNKKQIFMLGDIVHNPWVVNEIKKTGIKKINELKTPGAKILIIRAHGAGKNIYKKAKKLGYTIIDATCPMVKEIQSIAQRYENKKYKIIIIGDCQHDEVKGIQGNLKTNPLVISPAKKIPCAKFKNINRAVVLVQSTQNLDTVKKIVEKIKKFIPNFVFINTICYPTKQRQKEIEKMAHTQDMMVIIGAKSSANTKRLYELSKTINPYTFWINSKRGLKKEWFLNKNKIGMAAGASTPDYIIHEIQEYIRNF
ncbi:MAG: 4-hydroxy-3-methylbut-2-enyl diphosphate reductase [Candidatus Omnitrophota bacterium]